MATANHHTPRTIELELTLRPNVGWTVGQYVDGQYEGPIHDGFVGTKDEAHEIAGSFAKRHAGFDTVTVRTQTGRW